MLSLKAFHRWLLSTPHASFNVNPLAQIYMPSEVQIPSVTKALIQYFLPRPFKVKIRVQTATSCFFWNSSRNCFQLMITKAFWLTHSWQICRTPGEDTHLHTPPLSCCCVREAQGAPGWGGQSELVQTNNQLINRSITWVNDRLHGVSVQITQLTHESTSCTEQSAPSVW